MYVFGRATQVNGHALQFSRKVETRFHAKGSLKRVGVTVLGESFSKIASVRASTYMSDSMFMYSHVAICNVV